MVVSRKYTISEYLGESSSYAAIEERDTGTIDWIGFVAGSVRLFLVLDVIIKAV